jgi:chloramphenicol O-acetyltransferase type A
MKYIDMQTWPRRELFKFFSTMDYPHFNICSQLDITNTHHYAKSNQVSLFKAILFAICKAANSIPEFKTRIRGDQVVEHEVVHPSTTILNDEKVFGFCHIDYTSQVSDFFEGAGRSMDAARNKLSLVDEPGRDDYLFITVLPWIRFTGVCHPIHMNPVDSVPRIGWGKYCVEGGKVEVPLATQLHHAVADGYHVGLFITALEEMLAEPESLLGGLNR